MAEAEGIPPTASVASVGKGLRYIGTEPMYAYAFSGSYEATTAAQTVLDFDSGGGFIYGKLELFAGTNFASPGNGTQTTAQVAFNGEVINVLKNVSKYPSEGQGNSGTCRVIIPPFTNVVVQIDSNEDTAAELCHVIFTGRVYDA